MIPAWRLRTVAASNIKERPRQESNLVYDLRKVACESGTLRGPELRSIPIVERKGRESNPQGV